MLNLNLVLLYPYVVRAVVHVHTAILGAQPHRRLRTIHLRLAVRLAQRRCGRHIGHRRGRSCRWRLLLLRVPLQLGEGIQGRSQGRRRIQLGTELDVRLIVTGTARVQLQSGVAECRRWRCLTTISGAQRQSLVTATGCWRIAGRT